MKWRLGTWCLLAALAGCSRSDIYRNYEVGELEEERVQKAVKAISGGLERMDAEACVSTLEPGFRAPFDRGQLTTQSSADGMSVSRWSPTGTAPDAGKAEIRKWFEEYLATWKVVERGLAKIRHIEFAEDNLACRGRFFIDVYGLSSGGEAREDFLYADFSFRREGDAWLITSIAFDPRNFSSHCGRPQFRNVSLEANAAQRHEVHPNAHGYLAIPEETPDSGVACGDYDGDGFYDLYLCNGKGNHLLRNKGDGTFEDVTEKAGVADFGESKSAIIADFDNDGHPDIYVANNISPSQLYRNNGDGTFRNVTKGSGVDFSGWSTSCTALDYDRDGLLDIYQGVYGNFYEEFPLPPAFDAPPNRLYHNLGGMKFEEVGPDAGVDNTGWTLAVTTGDPNNDGWPDILVSNDFGDKKLFINQKDGTFEDVAWGTPAQDRNFGMSGAFGDIDGDGKFDMYFSNMYSNTNWIFAREQLIPMPWFLAWLRDKILGTLDSMTKGNTMVRQGADGTWENITIDAGLDYGQWAWGSEFVDYDADGDLDIYCMNGFVSGDDSEDL